MGLVEGQICRGAHRVSSRLGPGQLRSEGRPCWTHLPDRPRVPGRRGGEPHEVSHALGPRIGRTPPPAARGARRAPRKHAQRCGVPHPGRLIVEAQDLSHNVPMLPGQASAIAALVTGPLGVVAIGAGWYLSAAVHLGFLGVLAGGLVLVALAAGLTGISRIQRRTLRSSSSFANSTSLSHRGRRGPPMRTTPKPKRVATWASSHGPRVERRR